MELLFLLFHLIIVRLLNNIPWIPLLGKSAKADINVQGISLTIIIPGNSRTDPEGTAITNNIINFNINMTDI
jgi:hypothetical protein